MMHVEKARRSHPDRPWSAPPVIPVRPVVAGRRPAHRDGCCSGTCRPRLDSVVAAEDPGIDTPGTERMALGERRERASWLCRHRWQPAVGQRVAELPARADVELGEYLRQVPLDSARADEELGSYLRIRLPVSGQLSDLRLLSGEAGGCLDRAFAHRSRRWPGARARARSANASAPMPLNMSCARRSCSARVQAPLLAAQPFAVQQVGSGELDGDPAAGEPLHGFAIEGFGRWAVGQHCA